MAAEDLTRVLDEAGVRYELLPHARTETALAEAKALGVTPAEVAKTIVVATAAGYVRAVLPAPERIDLRKLRELRGGGTKDLHFASEGDLARDYAEFEVGGRAADRRSPSRSGCPRHSLGRARLDRRGGGDARGLCTLPDSRSVGVANAEVGDICAD